MDVGRKEWVSPPVHPALSRPNQFNSLQSCPSPRSSLSSSSGLDLESSYMGSNQEGAISMAVR
jgi:hypothetical protein